MPLKSFEGGQLSSEAVLVLWVGELCPDKDDPEIWASRFWLILWGNGQRNSSLQTNCVGDGQTQRRLRGVVRGRGFVSSSGFRENIWLSRGGAFMSARNAERAGRPATSRPLKPVIRQSSPEDSDDHPLQANSTIEPKVFDSPSRSLCFGFHKGYPILQRGRAYQIQHDAISTTFRKPRSNSDLLCSNTLAPRTCTR